MIPRVSVPQSAPAVTKYDEIHLRIAKCIRSIVSRKEGAKPRASSLPVVARTDFHNKHCQFHSFKPALKVNRSPRPVAWEGVLRFVAQPPGEFHPQLSVASNGK